MIEQLPQRHQAAVADQGVGLFRGQRQRIAIARALLRKPRVLIADEAASNFDSATAEAFSLTVNALRVQATILFIAHEMPRRLEVDRSARLASAPSPKSYDADFP